MMTKQREATPTTLQPSMHTRLHGVLHFAAPSYLGSQEEIFLLPKKTRLCASRPQQPLLRESARESFFPTQSPAHKKKEQKKQNPERKKFRIENFQLQIQQSGNTNHRLKLQEINFAATANPKALAKPTSPRKKLKKPYNRWIILSPKYIPTGNP
jgi:hypothetical protein